MNNQVNVRACVTAVSAMHLPWLQLCNDMRVPQSCREILCLLFSVVSLAIAQLIGAVAQKLLSFIWCMDWNNFVLMLRACQPGSCSLGVSLEVLPSPCDMNLLQPSSSATPPTLLA